MWRNVCCKDFCDNVFVKCILNRWVYNFGMLCILYNFGWRACNECKIRQAYTGNHDVIREQWTRKT